MSTITVFVFFVFFLKGHSSSSFGTYRNKQNVVGRWIFNCVNSPVLVVLKIYIFITAT